MQPVEAIARLVLGPQALGREESTTKLDPKDRVAAVKQILPYLEQTRQYDKQAASLEVLRASDETSPTEKVELDRA